MGEEWGRNGGGMGKGHWSLDVFFANIRRAVLQITNCKPLE